MIRGFYGLNHDKSSGFIFQASCRILFSCGRMNLRTMLRLCFLLLCVLEMSVHIPLCVRVGLLNNAFKRNYVIYLPCRTVVEVNPNLDFFFINESLIFHNFKYDKMCLSKILNITNFVFFYIYNK